MQNLKFFYEVSQPLRGSCETEIQMVKGSENSIDGDFFGMRVKGNTFVTGRTNFNFICLKNKL